MAIKFESAEDFSAKTNEKLRKLVLGENVGIKLKLDEVLESRNMNMAQLAEVTGIRNTTLGNYSNNLKSTTLNLQHLMAIIIALRVTDITELLEIEFPDKNVKKRWKEDLKLWQKNNWRPVYKEGQPED